METTSSRGLKPLDLTTWRSLDAALLLILLAVSVFNFVRRGPTAFEWPGNDMGCFFERQADPHFLPDDYFTNSVVEPSPRHVFGYVVLGLARALGTDWYGAYFALRALMTCTLPMLWYLALIGIVKDRLTDDRMRWTARVILGTAVVLVMRRAVSNWFSIAWWPPYFLYVGAHPLALYCALLGIVLVTYCKGRWRQLSLPVWLIASLIHPAIGLFVVTFYWLATFDSGRWRERFAQLTCAVVIPFGILAWLFRPDDPLSAAEFVDAYVITTHPFHYRLAEFASLTKHPWWVNFFLVLGLMLTTASVAWRRSNERLARLATLFALSYAGCVVIQFILTEISPSKAIATLGPSRFTFLGYFMLAILAVMLFCEVWPVRWASPSLIRRLVPVWLERLKPWHAAGITAAMVVALFALLKDDLQDEIRSHYAGFYDWVESNTSPDAVFLPPFNEPLHRELPVVSRRAVVASQCFPFREDAIREHIRRLTLVYGTNAELARCEGKDQIRRRQSFFRALGPDELIRIADQLRLDYVVVEADHRAQFEGYPVQYADDSVAVYEVASFRKHPYQPTPSRPSSRLTRREKQD